MSSFEESLSVWNRAKLRAQLKEAQEMGCDDVNDFSRGVDYHTQVPPEDAKQGPFDTMLIGALKHHSQVRELIRQIANNSDEPPVNKSDDVPPSMYPTIEEWAKVKTGSVQVIPQPDDDRVPYYIGQAERLQEALDGIDSAVPGESVFDTAVRAIDEYRSHRCAPDVREERDRALKKIDRLERALGEIFAVLRRDYNITPQNIEDTGREAARILTEYRRVTSTSAAGELGRQIAEQAAEIARLRQGPSQEMFDDAMRSGQKLAEEIARLDLFFFEQRQEGRIALPPPAQDESIVDYTLRVLGAYLAPA